MNKTGFEKMQINSLLLEIFKDHIFFDMAYKFVYYQ
jgi:hypothetical protein